MHANIIHFNGLYLTGVIATDSEFCRIFITHLKNVSTAAAVSILCGFQTAKENVNIFTLNTLPDTADPVDVNIIGGSQKIQSTNKKKYIIHRITDLKFNHCET